jgi:uncharacterized protein with HEPN domain
MSEKEKKYLLDILMAIEEIERFFGGNYYFDDFKSNMMLKSAVERQLITVGEAMNRLLAINANISITSARNIVQFRNKITHEYDVVDDVITWAVVVNHLPTLKEEVKVLLES